MSFIVPAPLKDLWNCCRVDGRDSRVIKEERQLLAARCLVAALAIFAIYKALPILHIFPFCAAISLPAAFMAGGACLSYYGIVGVIACVASKSFAALAISLLKLIAGVILIQTYSEMPAGLLESLIRAYNSKLSL